MEDTVPPQQRRNTCDIILNLQRNVLKFYLSKHTILYIICLAMIETSQQTLLAFLAEKKLLTEV